MPCIQNIYSVSILVGSEKCNANCPHCAGKYLREHALPSSVGTTKNLSSALRLCHMYQGWALSLTGSGEPTISPEVVTKTMEEIDAENVKFPFINMFTNGILLGDEDYAKRWLPEWKRLGMTAVAVSVHSTDHKEQSKAYGLNPLQYPKLEKIFENIKKHGLVPRVTLLLGKDGINNAKKYKKAIDDLKAMGIHMITSWPLQSYDGKRNKYTPSRWGMLGIRFWLMTKTKRVLGHAWGGGVYDYEGISVRLTQYVSKHRPRNKFIRQLVVFQDGTVAYSWFQKGAFCIK